MDEAQVLMVIHCTTNLSITRDNQLLRVLLLRWSTELHTFVSSWGKIGPTLEDVDMLLRLNLLGEIDWSTYMFEGEEQDTLVGLQNGYTAVCVWKTFCGLPIRILMHGELGTFLGIIP